MASEETIQTIREARDSIREWVCAEPTMQQAEGTVVVAVSHSNLKDHRVIELRLDLDATIGRVKDILHTYNGTKQQYMELHLRNGQGQTICKMLDDDKMLGYYGVQNGQEIFCLDTDPYSISRNGALDDVSQVQKYVMSDEEYERRENTLRAYKKEQLKINPNFRFFPKVSLFVENDMFFFSFGVFSGFSKSKLYLTPIPLPFTQSNENQQDFESEECVQGINVGDRCEVAPGARRGTVKYVGKVESLPSGYFVST
jgi:tubulin-folding cofactor B